MERADARPDDDRVAGGLVDDDVVLAPAIVSWPRARWAIWATRLPIVPLRDEQAGLLAEQLGGALLEGVDRRVVAEDVVADLGVGHRAAHRGGRMGDGVGAEVDTGHGRGEYSAGCVPRLALARDGASGRCSRVSPLDVHAHARSRR